MASADHIQSLREEATCSLCLEFYKDPVTIKCGHNFCRHCILRVSSSQGAACDLPCPQCRELCPQGELRINRQLQSMVDIVQQLPVHQPVKLQGESLCQKHQEKLKLFCKEDEGLICVICRESRGHRAHTALPLDEAAQEYKSQLQERLQPLRKEMEALLQSKQKEEEGYRTLRNKLEIERLKIMQEFDVMQQHLKEQEKALLGRLEEMDRSINGAENTHIAKLSSEISSIKALISEIEMKSEQLPEDLLKDVRSTLDRCENMIPQKPDVLRIKYRELVTLDRDTHHCRLFLSEDGKRVRDTCRQKLLPDNPKRFTVSTCVLGKEGFSSGRHYWELQLLAEGGWRVGVIRESVSRKESVPVSPERGVWAVMRRSDDGQYQAFTSSATVLFPRLPLKNLGFYLNYVEGRLSVYNSDTMELLYSFTGTPFTERVFPFFWIWSGTDLCLV